MWSRHPYFSKELPMLSELDKLGDTSWQDAALPKAGQNLADYCGVKDAAWAKENPQQQADAVINAFQSKLAAYLKVTPQKDTFAPGERGQGILDALNAKLKTDLQQQPQPLPRTPSPLPPIEVAGLTNNSDLTMTPVATVAPTGTDDTSDT
jgi:hypothetical protein